MKWIGAMRILPVALVKGHDVWRDVDDGNDITAWHDFSDLAAAKAIANSSELKEAMKTAGVVGAPTIWIAQKS